MSDLGAINVKFGADISSLTAGIATGKGQVTGFSDDVSKAMSNIAQAQQKATEAARQLDLAQANAALALKRAQDMAASGKASDEQLAVAQSQAALAAEKVAAAQINLTNAEEKAAQAANQEAEAEDKVATANKEAASASDGFSFSLGGMIGKVMDFGSRLGMAVIGVQGLIQGAKDLAMGLLGPGISAEEVSSSLQVFTGSAKKAQQELQQLSDFASHTPFETQAIDDAALKLQGVGISAQDVIPDIKALGDGLDAMGRVSSADLAMIVDSFMKIKTQGHLTTDVMNSFALQGIDAWSVLEKQTGKTHAELAALISKGLYPANQAMHDLTVGIEASPLYKGQMANDSATFTGALSTLKSNFDQVLASFDSPILKAIEPLMSNLGTAFSSPGFKDFAGSVGKDLVSTLTQIGQIGKSLFGDINLGDFANVGDKVHQVFITIQKDLSVINPNDLKAGLSDLFSILGSGAQIVDTITGTLETFAIGLLDAANKSGVVQDVLSAVKDILPDVGKFFTQIGGDLTQNVLPSLELLIENVGSAVGRFAEWLDKSGTAKNLLSNLGDIIGSLSGTVGTLVGWVADLIGWFTSGGPQTYVLAEAVGILGAAFLGLKIADTVAGFANMFGKLQEGDGIISNLAGSVKDKLGKAFDDMIAQQFPNLKQNLDDLKTKTDDAGQSMDKLGTEAETTSGKIEAIGPAATVAQEDVAIASGEMEGEITSVGTEAEATSGGIKGIGEAATVSKGSVATAASGMMASLLPVIALMGNISQFQNNLAHPANKSSVGDNIKNGFLDGIFPAGALANIKNAWDQFTQDIQGHSFTMEKTVSGNAGAMSKNVQDSFSKMESVGYSNTSSLSATAQQMFTEMAGGINSTMSDLDSSTIGYFNDIAAYVDKMNTLQQQAEANVRQTGSPNMQGGYGGSTVGHHAMGGFNLPAGKSVVGEFGEEIIDVPGGSNIYNNAMSRMMSGSGSSAPAVQPVIHNHFHVYLDGQEMTNIVMQHAASQILSHGPVQAVL